MKARRMTRLQGFDSCSIVCFPGKTVIVPLSNEFIPRALLVWTYIEFEQIISTVGVYSSVGRCLKIDLGFWNQSHILRLALHTLRCRGKLELVILYLPPCAAGLQVCATATSFYVVLMIKLGASCMLDKQGLLSAYLYSPCPFRVEFDNLRGK